METLEQTEDLVLVFGRYTDAVVADADHCFTRVPVTGNTDFRRRTRGAELQGVLQKLMKELSQVHLIHAQSGKIAGMDRCPCFDNQRLQRAEDATQHGI